MSVPSAVVALAPLAVSVVLAQTGTRLGALLPPPTAVRLLTVTALVTALSSGFVLAVAGFVAVAQLPPVAVVGAWSARVLGAREPLPLVLGAVCALTSVGLMAMALRRLVQGGRDLVVAAATCRRLGEGADGLVVVDDDRPDAYALPGLGGRVVVSTGMLRALPAPERRVLLAHEAAHLRHRHHLYLQVAELSAAANPLLAPLAAAVHGAIERWADEEAAAVVGDRSVVARAVARASLVAHAGRTHPVTGRPVRVALRMADTLVVGRARALLAPVPPPRRMLALAVTVLMLTGAGGAVLTGHRAEDLFEVARVALRTAR